VDAVRVVRRGVLLAILLVGDLVVAGRRVLLRVVGLGVQFLRDVAFHGEVLRVVFFLGVAFFVFVVHLLVLLVRLGIYNPPFDMRVNVIKPEWSVWLIIFFIGRMRNLFRDKDA
jgi:hypothetical protein